MFPEIEVKSLDPMASNIDLENVLVPMLEQQVGLLNCLHETVCSRMLPCEDGRMTEEKELELAVQVAANHAEGSLRILREWVKAQRSARHGATEAAEEQNS